VSKVTGEIARRTVAAKLRQHQRNPAGAGVCVATVPAELRDVPCLADAEILALAGLGRRVSEHYGTPQDIEWAITGAGATEADADRILLLQSRPETVWSHRPAALVAAPKARAFDHVLERMRAPGTTR
jgi:phosphoenolpyruvate synthase/pyruvate phosphate dikinase